MYLGIPIYEAWADRLPALYPVVLHVHRFVTVPDRTIYMLRDGRDIAVSYYHKLIRSNSPALSGAAEFCPAELTHEHLRENLAGFIRFAFQANRRSSLPYDRHVRRARSLGLFEVRYEDLLESTEETVGAAVRHLTNVAPDRERIIEVVQATSFEVRTGRPPGEENPDVNARKGEAGDWRNHFSREAARVFDRHAGGLLIELGYESDRKWIDRVPE